MLKQNKGTISNNNQHDMTETSKNIICKYLIRNLKIDNSIIFFIVK